jgi:hypothetical protein
MQKPGLLILFLFLFIPFSSVNAQNPKPVVNRTFSPIAGTNDYTVTIRIHAPGLRSFAKYEEVLPDGATVSELDPQKISVSNVNGNKLKFIWVDFPGAGEVLFTYRISFPSDKLAAASMSYPGTFRYVNENMAAAVSVGE